MMTHSPSHSITGTPIMVDNETGSFFVSLVEDNKFRSAIEGLYEYVLDTGIDFDGAYDWVCDQAEISTFVADQYAWDMFYDVFTQATK
jgi:hypothetical protein